MPHIDYPIAAQQRGDRSTNKTTATESRHRSPECYRTDPPTPRTCIVYPEFVATSSVSNGLTRFSSGITRTGAALGLALALLALPVRL